MFSRKEYTECVFARNMQNMVIYLGFKLEFKFLFEINCTICWLSLQMLYRMSLKLPSPSPTYIIYLAELLLCSYHFQKYYQRLDLLRIQLILKLLQPFIEGLDFKGRSVVFVGTTLEGILKDYSNISIGDILTVL